jgi:hypothetical protein
MTRHRVFSRFSHNVSHEKSALEARRGSPGFSFLISHNSLSIMRNEKITLFTFLARPSKCTITIKMNNEKRGTMTAAQRDYRRFLRTVDWLVQRSRIVVRSGGLREVCRKTRLKQVHHLRYAEPLAATPDSDLIGICGRCHRAAHWKPPQTAAAAEIQLF